MIKDALARLFASFSRRFGASSATETPGPNEAGPKSSSSGTSLNARGAGSIATAAGSIVVMGSSAGNLNTGIQIIGSRDEELHPSNLIPSGAEPPGQSKPQNPLAVKLYEALNSYAFGLDDLQDLAFSLRMDWDSLPGDAKAAKARSLINLLEREERLDALYDLARDKRPRYAW